MLVITGVAVSQGLSIFRPFTDDSGQVQSAPSDVMISTSAGSIVAVHAPLDDTNKFFDPGFGTNGQACVTCHQPSLGFTINVPTIQSTFSATGFTDPLLLNDTANNPNGSESTANSASSWIRSRSYWRDFRGKLRLHRRAAKHCEVWTIAAFNGPTAPRHTNPLLVPAPARQYQRASRHLRTLGRSLQYRRHASPSHWRC
jgi:hypothetical protein